MNSQLPILEGIFLGLWDIGGEDVDWIHLAQVNDKC